MSWHTARLADVCEFENGDRGKNYPGKSALLEDGIPFVNAGDLQEGVVRRDGLSFIAPAHYEKLSNGKFTQGDFLFCLRGSLGKFAYVDREIEGAIASSLIIIRPQNGLHPEYLKHYLGSGLCEKEIDLHSNGAAQPNLAASSLKQFKIPLPPLDEQKRIAAILDKADALRAKRRQAVALLDSLTQSIFLEMFGDPVSNPKGWPVAPLGDIADFISGGTPSKSSPSYWTGLIPWVSPKDMKSVIISDAIDHISESAILQSAAKLVPEDTILIVVRGMILAHSVPIAKLSGPAAFNQDIKGIRFHSSIEPQYGLWNLLSLRSQILQEVSSAAHGTKRIDMDVIYKLPVLCAPVSMQQLFKKRCEIVMRNAQHLQDAKLKTDEIFEVLQSKLFSGGAAI